MCRLEMRWQLAEVAHGERWQLTSHGNAIGHLMHHPEHHATIHCFTERAVRACGERQAERVRRFTKIEFVSVGVCIEAHHEPSQHPCRSGSENAEPEKLDIRTPRVIPDCFDHRVVPRHHNERLSK